MHRSSDAALTRLSSRRYKLSVKVVKGLGSNTSMAPRTGGIE